MKVLMVNKAYPPWTGGIESHLHQLCQTLKDKVDLDVLVSNVRFKTEIEHMEGYRVIRVASLGYMSSTHLGVSFPWWMRSLNPDVIHFHFPYPVAEAAYLLSGIKCRQVVTYHVDVVHHPVIWKMLSHFENSFLEHADRIIASSQNMLNNSPLLSRYKDKTTVIPYGIDVGQFCMTDNIKDKVAGIRGLHSVPILLFAGRLVPYKGVDVLIQAMNQLEAILFIVGEGPSREGLMRLVEANGLKDKVYFLGTVQAEELVSYYHACDLFVLPSVDTAEAFGIVQLEAHACGKPVVSTDLPTGVPYANLDGITGLIVPPRSPSKLAEAINRLLKDDRLRLRLGRQAKERVSSEFTEEIMARKILEVYEDVLKRS